MSAFEFFNERRTGQQNGERNKKLYGGEAPESEAVQHRVHGIFQERGLADSRPLPRATTNNPITTLERLKQEFTYD